MATESDLRDLLRGPEPEGRGDIDLETVLSRTRRRRRPRVIAAQALGSLAVVGVLGTAIFVAAPLGDRGVLMTAEDAGAGADGVDEESATTPLTDQDALRWTPDSCGAQVTGPIGSEDVTLETVSATSVESGQRVTVTLTLRNDGPDRLVGTSSAIPYVSLAREGVIVWHSYATQDAGARIVDLEPGESMTVETFFDSVSCGSEDDLVMDDPQNPLPPAPPGRYELRAVLVVTTDSGDGVLAASAPLVIEIR